MRKKKSPAFQMLAGNVPCHKESIAAGLWEQGSVVDRVGNELEGIRAHSGRIADQNDGEGRGRSPASHRGSPHFLIPLAVERPVSHEAEDLAHGSEDADDAVLPPRAEEPL